MSPRETSHQTGPYQGPTTPHHPATRRSDRALNTAELICDRLLTAITATLLLATATSTPTDLAIWWWM